MVKKSKSELRHSGPYLAIVAVVAVVAVVILVMNFSGQKEQSTSESAVVGEAFRFLSQSNKLSTQGGSSARNLLRGSNLRCSDSDGGFVTSVRGTITWSLPASPTQHHITDECTKSGGGLVEFYCSDDIIKNEIVSCPYGCSAGSCEKLR